MKNLFTPHAGFYQNATFDLTITNGVKSFSDVEYEKMVAKDPERWAQLLGNGTIVLADGGKVVGQPAGVGISRVGDKNQGEVADAVMKAPLPGTSNQSLAAKVKEIVRQKKGE